ncbi:MAG: sensor histidine kinase [Roseibium sp.]|nr:sensor histidine kinase [Roseibium sp.]
MNSQPSVHGSIQRRLVVLLLIGAAVLAVLLYFVVQSIARQIAQESQDNILSASAISILDSASVQNGEITIDLPYAAFSMLGTVADERIYYSISMGEDFLSGYEDLPGPPGSRGSDNVFYSTHFRGEDVRIASTRRIVSIGPVSQVLEVSVAQTLDGQRETLSRISRIALAVGASFFLLTALFATIVARSTTKPLHRLAESVARRGPKDLRPVAAPVPSEMAPLVSSLNSFMDRLQNSLVQSEEFIAEAAHRVRTPLAVVRTRAEITLRRVEKAENRAAVREMIRAIDESSRSAGQMLDHAMVTFRADHLVKEPVDLAAIVKDTVERLQPLSELRDVDLRVAGLEPAEIQGDPILIQNALRNLLDNAIKYSKTDGWAEVSLVRDAGRAVVIVKDNGPGFPPDPAKRLVGRYSRGENVTGTVGSGLGLTIVDEVARAHNGALHYGNSEEGGACVKLSFPFS